MKKINRKYLFMFLFLALLTFGVFGCKKQQDPTKETQPGGKTQEPEVAVKSIALDEASLTEVLAQDIFNYHNIKFTVTYVDDTTKTLNLEDSMLSSSELAKFSSFGKKKITVTYGGKSCTFEVNIPRSSLYAIEIDADSLTNALSAEYFNFTKIMLNLIYTNNTKTQLALSDSMLSSDKIASLYTKGEKSFEIKYSGKTTTLSFTNEKDLIIGVGELKNVPDGEIVAVKGYVTTFTSTVIYLYDDNGGSYANCLPGVTGMGKNLGVLSASNEIILVATKTTTDGMATLKDACGIGGTGEKADLSQTVEVSTSEEVEANLFKFVNLTNTKVSVAPTRFSSNYDCVFNVTDGKNEILVVVPSDTDDKFTQKLYITLAELCVTHDVTIENAIASKYDGKNAVLITTESKVSYVSLADEYHRPEEGEKNTEFEALLDELLIWFLGDNPFDINYMIYDVAAFDAKHGTDLAHAKAEPSTIEDMTPEHELEYYQELLDKKAQVEAFDIDTLSHSEKIAYKVILDKLQRSLNFYQFDDTGKNKLFYYGIQLGSYLGYQAQLPSLLSDYRFDDKKDIDDYLDFMYYTKSDFEAIVYFEKSKIESGEGNQISDFVIDLVIEQCENFAETSEVNYLIPLFENRIYDYDFLTKDEADEYVEKNKKYINEYFIPAYAWLKQQLIELKELNDDTKTGGLSNLPYGKDYYQVYFQSQCGTDMTIEELIAYIDAKNEYKKSFGWDSYSGNLMKDAGLIVSDGHKPDYYASLYGILPFNQEKCAADFPAVKASYKVGENIIINEIPKELQENSSPAYYMTSPIDATTSEFFYINPPEFSELNSYMYQTVSHEAWPGHLYQTVYFKETDNHDIRKVISYTSYAEGWANYVENYVPKYVLEDYSQIQMFLLDIIDSLDYCKLDIGINYQNWQIKDVIEYYGLTVEDVESGKYKWTNGDTVSMDDFEDIYYRFVEVPSNYLKYYLSACIILDMRAEFKELMGVYYSDMVFHTILLEVGDAPWTVIRDELLDYAAKWGTNGTER